MPRGFWIGFITGAFATIATSIAWLLWSDAFTHDCWWDDEDPYRAPDLFQLGPP